MRSREIQHLIDAVESRYGRTRPYGGDAEDGHGTGFIIEGPPATFSVHTQEGTLPSGEYDIQIESYPPGDYMYTSVVSLAEFLDLVARLHGPEDQWPVMT